MSLSPGQRAINPMKMPDIGRCAGSAPTAPQNIGRRSAMPSLTTLMSSRVADRVAKTLPHSMEPEGAGRRPVFCSPIPAECCRWWYSVMIAWARVPGAAPAGGDIARIASMTADSVWRTLPDLAPASHYGMQLAAARCMLFSFVFVGQTHRPSDAASANSPVPERYGHAEIAPARTVCTRRGAETHKSRTRCCWAGRS